MPCSTNFPFGFKSADIDGFPIQFSDLAQLSLYAERVGVTGPGMPASIKEVVIASLATNRIIYCKAKQGDCGSPTQPSLGAGGISARIGQTAAGGVGGAASAGLLGTAAAGSTLLAATTFGIGLALVPVLAILQHHAVAVAIEQKTLCDVSNAWNGFAMAIEQTLLSGKIAAQDAKAQFSAIHDHLIGALSGIEKPGNAAIHYHKALDALLIFNQEVVITKFSGGLLSGFLPKALITGGVVGVAKLAGAF